MGWFDVQFVCLIVVLVDGKKLSLDTRGQVGGEEKGRRNPLTFNFVLIFVGLWRMISERIGSSKGFSDKSERRSIKCELKVRNRTLRHRFAEHM